MTIKIKLVILSLTATSLLILMGYIASKSTGFSLIAFAKPYTQAFAQTNDPPPPEALFLTDQQGEYPLGLHLQILEDTSGNLTIDDVSSPEFGPRFVPSKVAVPNFGFTNSIIWVRFSLYNQAPHTNEWLLEQGFANTHYVDLYTPLPDGEGFSVKQTGVLRPTSTRDVVSPRIIFSLTIPHDSLQTYYLRFQSGASMTLPLTLWTQSAFLNQSVVEQYSMGIYYGILLGLLFYNLFLLISLREANYLYLVILLACTILEEITYDGYWYASNIHKLIIPIQYFQPLFTVLMIAFIVLFSDSFLELKSRLPKLHQVNLVIFSIWGVLVLLIPFTSYHFLANLVVPWALFSLMTVFITGIASWIRGFRPARFFMLAWFGMVASIFLIFLIRSGWFSSTSLGENAYRLGILWMAICWSLALADRINLLKAETESANHELSNSEHRLSQLLEGLPLGVVLYGKDQKPKYANQRTIEILSNPSRGIQPDLSVGRSLAQAIQYFSLKISGSDLEYPLENLPVYSALRGEPAAADDIEVDKIDRRVPLEIWASPISDDDGNVESAVVAFQDITQRRQAEAELVAYRKQLELLVQERTTELQAVNEQLQMRLDWLSAVNLINQIMARSADFSQIYEKIIEIINNLFASQGAFIAEWDTGGRKLKILMHSCRDKTADQSSGTIINIPESLLPDPNLGQSMLAYISREQLSTISGPMGTHFLDSGVQNIVLVPLILREQVFGLLGLEMGDEGRQLTNEETAMLTNFSVDIAQLIEDSRLFKHSKALIVAEERNRLSRDLHDSVTQTLFTASVLAQATPRIWDKNQKLARQNMEKLSLLIRGALAEMRSMLLELRSGDLQNQTLQQLLATLVEAGQVRTHATISLSITGECALPNNVTLTFYHIAQESVNNAINHAKPNQIFITLIEGQGSVELRIQDDGTGFVPQEVPEGHLGINIMLERAAQIGANLRIISEPGEGSEVILTWSEKEGLEGNGRANTH